MLSPSATIRGREGVFDTCTGAGEAGACARAGSGFDPHAAAASSAQATTTAVLGMHRELAFELGDRLLEHTAMRGRGRRGELVARPRERQLDGPTPRGLVAFLRGQGAGNRARPAVRLGLLIFDVLALEA